MDKSDFAFKYSKRNQSLKGRKYPLYILTKTWSNFLSLERFHWAEWSLAYTLNIWLLFPTKICFAHILFSLRKTWMFCVFIAYSLILLFLCFMPVYDVTRRDTFSNLSDIWLKEVDLYSTNQDCIKMLVGNKVDKVNMIKITWGILINTGLKLCVY